LPFGSAPTGLALSADGRTLWVTLGGNNAVAVVDLALAQRSGPTSFDPETPYPAPDTSRETPAPRAARVVGFIPTGWYPGAVVTDGKALFIANVKGTGAPNRPAGARGFNTHQHLGTL